MIFSEPRFLYFFAVVFVVGFSLRSNRARKLWLLAAWWRRTGGGGVSD